MDHQRDVGKISPSPHSQLFSAPLKRDVSAYAVQKCKYSNNSVLCYWQGFRAHRKPYFMSFLLIHVQQNIRKGKKCESEDKYLPVNTNTISQPWKVVSGLYRTFKNVSLKLHKWNQFQVLKNIFRANQEWEISRDRRKFLNGRDPFSWAEIGSSSACHIRTRHTSSCIVGFSQIGFGKQRYPLPECQETHQVTLSPFTLWSTVLFKSSRDWNTSLRIHPTTSMKSRLWISSVSASWQQTEFKMQNASWKSDKFKRRKKEAFYLKRKEKVIEF